MTDEEKKKLAKVTIGLMCSEHMGDVGREIPALFKLLGLVYDPDKYFDYAYGTNTEAAYEALEQF